jgi:glycosyltransferase involved in cell wall biosynthesis
MQIAFFTNNYLPVINGVVRSVNSFRQTLTEMGHNVFVFAQEDDYEDQEPFIFRYPSVPLPASVEIPAAIPISPSIDWLLPKLKLDVIHTHHPVLLGQTAARKAKKLGIPFVFTFHTQYQEYTHYFPLPQESVQEFLKDAVHEWLRHFMRTCHHIVVPSESMLKIVAEEYGLQSQFTVIPTGIDLQPYQSANGEQIREKHGWQEKTVMITAGRLAKEKNLKFLLQSAALALKTHPRLQVVLLGDGPERKNLENFASSLGIRDKVLFLGHIPFDQMPTYLKAADLFCFASTTETQGLVTLEALAAGLPVVAVNASGTRDVVEHHKQGILVDEDPRVFAQAIDLLLGRPELFLSYHRQALQRAQQFEISIQARRLLDVYAQADEARQAGRFAQVAS